MSNLSHKYKSVKKYKAGPMLNHTQRTLRDYFREPMKRLASLLHDKKYTWDDIYINNWIHLVGRMGCKKNQSIKSWIYYSHWNEKIWNRISTNIIWGKIAYSIWIKHKLKSFFFIFLLCSFLMNLHMINIVECQPYLCLRGGGGGAGIHVHGLYLLE